MLGPNAHYSGREECEEHWRKIRDGIRQGQRPAELHPPLTLAQQAERQIAILERDLVEWREIRRQALS